MTLIRQEAFNVRGTNYAVAMTTDIGFLATGLTPIKEAFGIELGTGNTFALPCAAGSPGGMPKAVTTRRAGKVKSNGGTAGRDSDKTVPIEKNKGKEAAVRLTVGVRGAPQNTGRSQNDPDRSSASATENSSMGVHSKVGVGVKRN